MPRMTGKRAMLEQLIADGVQHVFGNPGTTEQGFMDVLQDYPQVQFMLALHEGVAVSMADAYARLTRRPAFVEVHIAPGLGNALGMMHNAAIGKTPLVVYAGQSPGRVLLQEPHLSGPLVDMARPICKWSAQIHHAHLSAAVEVTEPGRMVRVRGGGIGPGLPGSLGAQLARPDRKVVGVCSDGAAMYSISALWTAAHHKIPVTYVMLNNAAYRILKLNMVEYLGAAARGRRFVAMDLTDPELRFDRMAEAMGVHGRRVERPEDLGPALVDVAMESPVPLP